MCRLVIALGSQLSLVGVEQLLGVFGSPQIRRYEEGRDVLVSPTQPLPVPRRVGIGMQRATSPPAGGHAVVLAVGVDGAGVAVVSYGMRTRAAVGEMGEGS